MSKNMKNWISKANFDKHRKSYRKIRLGPLSHQPSGVKANENDLDLFSKYLEENNIKKIIGDTFLQFIVWLKEERGNKAESINRKEASLKCYFQHLCMKQVSGADKLPINYIPRAREPYSGPIKALDTNEVVKLLNDFDTGSILGFRDFLITVISYRLGWVVQKSLNPLPIFWNFKFQQKTFYPDKAL